MVVQMEVYEHGVYISAFWHVESSVSVTFVFLWICVTKAKKYNFTVVRHVRRY